MAFPKLSQRELFGLFDPNYDNYFGIGTMFLCVYDNDYEVCSETEIVIESVNDAPLIISDMFAQVGRGLEFNFELEGEDIDSDSLSFVFAGDVPQWVYITNNALYGNPEIVARSSLRSPKRRPCSLRLRAAGNWPGLLETST